MASGITIYTAHGVYTAIGSDVKMIDERFTSTSTKSIEITLNKVVFRSGSE